MRNPRYLPLKSKLLNYGVSPTQSRHTGVESLGKKRQRLKNEVCSEAEMTQKSKMTNLQTRGAKLLFLPHKSTTKRISLLSAWDYMIRPAPETITYQDARLDQEVLHRPFG